MQKYIKQADDLRVKWYTVTPNTEFVQTYSFTIKFNLFGHLNGFITTKNSLNVNNKLFTVNVDKPIEHVYGVACSNTGNNSFIINLGTNGVAVVDAQPSTQINPNQYFMFYLPIIF